MSYYSGNNLILISPIVVCIVAFELTRLVLDDYNKGDNMWQPNVQLKS